MSTYSDLILGTAGLVGYWRLGETAGPNAVDAFSTNDGTYAGCTFSQAGALRADLDTAVLLDGIDDKVTLPAVTFLAADSSCTVEFWIKIATADIAQMAAFSIGGNDNPNRCSALFWSDSNLYWDYGTDSTGRVSTSLTASYDRWVHAALVFNAATDLHEIYLDGLLRASTTNANSPAISLVGGEIGDWSAEASTVPIKGLMDEFALYNQALALADIHEHFLTGVRSGIPQQPLAASRW